MGYSWDKASLNYWQNFYVFSKKNFNSLVPRAQQQKSATIVCFRDLWVNELL